MKSPRFTINRVSKHLFGSRLSPELPARFGSGGASAVGTSANSQLKKSIAIWDIEGKRGVSGG